MGGYIFGEIMELLDLYNHDNQKLNQTMIRGEKIQQGQYFKIVHIWFKNHLNQYLIQQRNKTTDTFPYQWAPTAGTVREGESSRETCVRETKEELGLSITDQELRLIDIYPIDHDRASYIIEVYLVHKDIDIEALTIDIDEVKDVKWSNIKEIQLMIENKMFWNFLPIIPNYLDLLESV